MAKQPPSTMFAEDHLEPIRAFVHGNHGRLTQLTNRMREKTSTPITRQAVSRWLHQDPAKRQEPKLGIAIIMEEAARELQTSTPVAASADA